MDILFLSGWTWPSQVCGFRRQLKKNVILAIIPLFLLMAFPLYKLHDQCGHVHCLSSWFLIFLITAFVPVPRFPPGPKYLDTKSKLSYLCHCQVGYPGVVWSISLASELCFKCLLRGNLIMISIFSWLWNYIDMIPSSAMLVQRQKSIYFIPSRYKETFPILTEI